MCSGPEVIKLFSCSTQLSTEFILLVNVEMPTIVGILTFISMVYTTSERPKARNFFICRYFRVYAQIEFRAQLSKLKHEKGFITSRPCPYYFKSLLVSAYFFHFARNAILFNYSFDFNENCMVWQLFIMF